MSDFNSVSVDFSCLGSSLFGTGTEISGGDEIEARTDLALSSVCLSLSGEHEHSVEGETLEVMPESELLQEHGDEVLLELEIAESLLRQEEEESLELVFELHELLFDMSYYEKTNLLMDLQSERNPNKKKNYIFHLINLKL